MGVWVDKSVIKILELQLVYQDRGIGIASWDYCQGGESVPHKAYTGMESWLVSKDRNCMQLAIKERGQGFLLGIIEEAPLQPAIMVSKERNYNRQLKGGRRDLFLGLRASRFPLSRLFWQKDRWNKRSES